MQVEVKYPKVISINPLLPKEVKIQDLPNTSERDLQAFVD